MPLYDVEIEYFESAQSTRGRYVFNGRVDAHDRAAAGRTLLAEFRQLCLLSDGGWLADVLDVRTTPVGLDAGRSVADAPRRRERAVDRG